MLVGVVLLKASVAQRVIVPSTLSVTSPASMLENLTHQGALFGPYPAARIEGRLWYPNQGGADACVEWSPEQMQWKDPAYIGTQPVVLLNRGTCTFVTKVVRCPHACLRHVLSSLAHPPIHHVIHRNTSLSLIYLQRRAQLSGAAAVIIADNDATEPFVPLMADDGSGGDITIPAMIVTYAEGVKLRDYISALELEAANNTNCVAWRNTADCLPTGAREPVYDRDCDVNIPQGYSGYCECEDGSRAMQRGCGKNAQGVCLVCQGEGVETCGQACLDPRPSNASTPLPPGTPATPFVPGNLPPANASAIDPARRLRVALQYNHPAVNPTNKVLDLELWTSALVQWDTAFIADTKDIVEALYPRVTFAPHFFVQKGETFGAQHGADGCRVTNPTPGRTLPCGDQCINGGRYCSKPRYLNINTVLITGAAIVEENLRQICLWSELSSQPGGAGVGNLWWDYVVKFETECAKLSTTTSLVTELCSRTQMAAVGISPAIVALAIDDCSKRNMHPPATPTLAAPSPYVAADDVINLDLEDAIGLSAEKKITAVPTLVVDNTTVAGTVAEQTCPHVTAQTTAQWRTSCTVLDQLCSAYAVNDLPAACVATYCWNGPCPTNAPTNAPTHAPIVTPTARPTSAPITVAPTKIPTAAPTRAPIETPTKHPTFPTPPIYPTKAPVRVCAACRVTPPSPAPQPTVSRTLSFFLPSTPSSTHTHRPRPQTQTRELVPPRRVLRRRRSLQSSSPSVSLLWPSLPSAQGL
mgnify:FL=1